MELQLMIQKVMFQLYQQILILKHQQVNLQTHQVGQVAMAENLIVHQA